MGLLRRTKGRSDARTNELVHPFYPQQGRAAFPGGRSNGGRGGGHDAEAIRRENDGDEVAGDGSADSAGLVTSPLSEEEPRTLGSGDDEDIPAAKRAAMASTVALRAAAGGSPVKPVVKDKTAVVRPQTVHVHGYRQVSRHSQPPHAAAAGGC